MLTWASSKFKRFVYTLVCTHCLPFLPSSRGTRRPMSSSPFLGGGGFDLDVRKPCPSPSPRSSRFSSTSFSHSGESSCSSLAIFTKRSRAPRKRLNQSYIEAAALLSAVFPSNSIRPPPPPHQRRSPGLFPEAPAGPAELLLFSPFPSLAAGGGDASLFLPPPPENPACSAKLTPLLLSSVQSSSSQSSSPGSGFVTEPAASSPSNDDGGDNVFDPVSMLREMDAEDIDGIMGKLALSSSCINGGGVCRPVEKTSAGFGVELHRRALRRSEEDDDDGEWWRLSRVAVRELVPKSESSSPAPPPSTETTKTMKEKKNKRYLAIGMEEKPILWLKLNYEEVLKGVGRPRVAVCRRDRRRRRKGGERAEVQREAEQEGLGLLWEDPIPGPQSKRRQEATSEGSN